MGICALLRKGKEVISRQHRLLSPVWQRLTLSVLLLTAGCGQSGNSAPQTLSPGDWHTFEGTWTAAGTRRALRLGPDDRAAIFELTGSVLLTGAQRPAVGFRAQAIGFSDSRAGMQGRCVWKARAESERRSSGSRLPTAVSSGSSGSTRAQMRIRGRSTRSMSASPNSTRTTLTSRISSGSVVRTRCTTPPTATSVPTGR